MAEHQLQVGDAYVCPRCHETHIITQPYRDRSTAERSHLYVTCRGAHYFVGVAPRIDVEPEEQTG